LEYLDEEYHPDRRLISALLRIGEYTLESIPLVGMLTHNTGGSE